jgi:hypothetical protein
MQSPAVRRLPKCVESPLEPAVGSVFKYYERRTEEDLFRLLVLDVVLAVLPPIAVVPLESGDLAQVEHRCIYL